MLWRRIVRLLLEPAKDPLQDSLAVSLGRVATLRGRLDQQISDLRARTSQLHDPALQEQLQLLQAEHARLQQLQQRLTADLDAVRARRDLLSARQTAAETHLRLAELLEALDAAHARAAALWDLSATISEEALCPPSLPLAPDSPISRS